ncbi:MAG TPA: Uma2 family endonuclease [Ktedonobacteraceae bacterium]|nr:Uma2 family endonuclease [Ktedonobacteraceae bacterium]
MVADLKWHAMRVEDYLQLEKASTEARHEFLDGQLLMMSGGTIAHARIALNIAKLLDAAVGDSPCHVYTSDVRVQLSVERYVYPDVSVSCEASDHQDLADTIHSPRLIIEVLSPTTEAYDRGKKFICYQECATIQEYVLVNSRYQSVEVFRRNETLWTYQRFEPHQEIELISLNLYIPFASIYERVSIPLTEEH